MACTILGLLCMFTALTQTISISSPMVNRFELTANLQETEDLALELPLSSATLTSKTAYAIVVGVSDYPGSTSDLAYCDDDSQDIYSMLIDDFNFKSENIIYLQDSSATKGAISNAFDQIASSISEDDIFFFYYSGHGGGSTSNGGIYSYSIDSPHPYINNYDNMWSILHSDAAYMRVHFDAFDLENTYDYVYLGDTDLVNDWYYEDYTGYYGSGFWSGWIPLLSDNSLYIRMITDFSETRQGFSIDQYEVEVYNGTHFLCSYDSIPYDPTYFYLDTYLDSKLDTLNCNETFVILDACNTGGMIPEVQDIGRYIMTACSDDESSLESSGLEHGVFTNYFLESVNNSVDTNGDGVNSLEEMYSYTYSNTVSYSISLGYPHHPQEDDGILGESVLETTFGSLFFNQTANSLNFSFSLYGNGLIQELYLCMCDVSDSISYNIFDLTENATTSTGFENYSGIVSLDGATDLTGYGLFAKIEGNEIISLNYTISEDSDGDSLVDIVELANGLDPKEQDSDSDGLDDDVEFFGVTDPLDPDCDDDDLTDGQEVNVYHTDPLNPDTDGDGTNDGLEVSLGLDPLDPFSSLPILILNIAGIGIVISSSLYSVVSTQIKKKKSREYRTKFIPKKLATDSYKTHNILTVEKKMKPVYRPSTTSPSYYSRPTYQQTTMNVNELKNIIMNRTPPPKEAHTSEGMYATSLAEQGFLAINQGKSIEALNFFVKALMLGVPQPLNDKIKKILLDALYNTPSSNQANPSQMQPQPSQMQPQPSQMQLQPSQMQPQKPKFCTNCGVQNKATSKFCNKCGREL